MVLYTIVPPEELLAGFEEDDRQFMTVRRGHITMEVEPLQGGAARIMRVLSSDPADYLDDRWQPGSLIELGIADFDN